MIFAEQARDAAKSAASPTTAVAASFGFANARQSGIGR
jgi:hypothetical protein